MKVIGFNAYSCDSNGNKIAYIDKFIFTILGVDSLPAYSVINNPTLASLEQYTNDQLAYFGGLNLYHQYDTNYPRDNIYTLAPATKFYEYMADKKGDPGFGLLLENGSGYYARSGVNNLDRFTLYDNNGNVMGDMYLYCKHYSTAAFATFNGKDVTAGEPVSAYGSGSTLQYYIWGSSNQRWSSGAIDWINGTTNETPEITDPYNPGGSSGTGGGTGNFDGTSDVVDFPSLPTVSTADTGFITLFNPSLDELRSLSNYMWSSGFDIDTLKKLFANPMDAILGLSIVPVAVPNGGSDVVTVGNISTGVKMTKAGSQYVEVDCGTLNVNEFWGGYLDYDPYTKAELYLPYCGTHPLSVDDIMGKAVHVKYHVDVLSGACCAYVKCGGSVLYTFIGQCSSSIPISGNDWTNVINGVLSAAVSIGSMVATGGASAPMAVSSLASTAVNSMKPTVEKSGAMGGTGGMLAIQTPYMILTRPNQALPTNQNKFTGYPAFITENLSDITGYTEIDSVHLENIPATEQELSEIESLLKGGVIL